MVIEDRDGQGHLNSPRVRLKLARPLDRCAAAILDIILFVAPLGGFVAAPLKRFVTQSYFVEDGVSLVLGVGGFFLAFFVVGTLYQFAMLRIYQATVGKLLFGLEVVDADTQGRPGWGQCLKRSLFWWSGLGSLGLVYLAMFSHRSRRTIYDRLSDTMVMGKSSRFASSPNRIEVRSSYLVLASIGFFWSAIVIGIVGEFVGTLREHSGLHQFVEEQSKVCSEVEEFVSEGENQDLDSPKRVSAALALYAADSLSLDCLQAEVEQAFQQDYQSPVLYLAGSFVHASKPELSDGYLVKVCKLGKESDACKLSQVIEAWVDEDWSKIYSLFEELKSSPNPYVWVWAYEYLGQKLNLQMAKLFLDKMIVFSGLKDFTGMERVKWTWMSGRSPEAWEQMHIVTPFLSERNLSQLRTWICFEESESDCAFAKNESCLALFKFEEVEAEQADPSTTMSSKDKARFELLQSRRTVCKDGTNEIDGDLDESTSLGRIRQAKALLKKDRKQGIAVFRSIEKNEKQSEIYRVEAMSQWIDGATTKSELNEILSELEQRSRDWNWHKLAKRALRKSQELNDTAASAKLALQLKPDSWVELRKPASLKDPESQGGK